MRSSAKVDIHTLSNNELDAIADDPLRGARFKLIPFEHLRPSPDPAYLIKGLFPRVGLVVVWGPPKCGKSFWVTDAVLHTALGWEYRGHKVTQGAVVYCAFEGQDGYGKRAEAFRQRHLAEEAEPVPFYLVAARMSFVKDHPALIEAIKLQLGDRKPTSVTLDTLNRSLDGSESDDKDMGAYIKAADAVREAFGCVVIIVHHCGVEGTRPRGHTSLTGAVDAQIAVKRDAANNVVATVEWMKDGPEGEVIVSRLEIVPLGTDTDGDVIDSCVVLPVEGGAVQTASKPKLNARQRLALEALANCTGAPAPASLGMPTGLVVTSLDQWREEMLARAIIDKAGANPRADFKRITEQLQDRKLIGVRDDLVWRAAS